MVDLEAPKSPQETPKSSQKELKRAPKRLQSQLWMENVDFIFRILTFLKKQRFRSNDGFENVLGLSRAPFGSSWGSLGSSLGPLDRPKRASRFVLELSWASFARFLLPKMALGAFWGCLWLVLGAPEGLLRVVLASVKPISTIKTALPSFDTLFFLVVVVVATLRGRFDSRDPRFATKDEEDEKRAECDERAPYSASW